MANAAIDVHNLSKSYKIYAHPRHRLLEALWGGRRSYHRDFWALRDVTFQVEPGETLAIIGLNGCGKSTLLQVIARIIQPTLGQVAVTGRVASLLELGAGFNPEFTGRENVLIQGSLLGFARKETEARLPAIEAFAELGTFIDQPVKTYSSGMLVRLAFATAIHTDPDILLVDEALAVGDIVFQHRCIRKIKEYQAQGKTICFVSHDTRAVTAVSSRALLLHAGEVVKIGAPAEIVNLYHSHVARTETRGIEARMTEAENGHGGGPVTFLPDPEFDQRVGLFRHGTGAARIRNVELLDPRGRRLVAVESGIEVTLRVHASFHEDVPTSFLGFIVRDKHGIDLIGTNNDAEGEPIPTRRSGDTLVVDFRLRLPLQPDTYSVTVALAYSPSLPAYMDWVDNCLVFEVLPPGLKRIHARIWLPVEISIHS